MKQTTEYNCGVFAVKYILKLVLNKDYDVVQLEKELCTTEEKGTSHDDIINFIKREKINYIVGIGEQMFSDLPLLVNYQYDGDGHYGVITDIHENEIKMFNPATGESEIILYTDFMDRWYSERYGKQWGLHIEKEVEFIDCDAHGKEI